MAIPYDPNATCPKCGAGDMNVKFCAQCPESAAGEHLHNTCKRCGFRRLMCTKDSTPPPDRKTLLG